MRQWFELIKAIYHYLHDNYEPHPENDHEIRVVNALIDLRGDHKL